MSAFSRRLAHASGGLLIGVLTMLGAVSGLSSAQAADGGDGGIDIAVTTTATPGAPTPTPTTTAGPIPPRASTGTGSAPSGSAPTASGGTSQPAIDLAAADTFDLGGVLYISGVRSGFTPSVNPFDGTLEVSFTVKNVSKSTFDSSARLWLTTVLGSEIGSKAEVSVPALKPGESRVVSAPLSGVGQWVLVTAHATFTPPATIDGTAVPPVTREAVVAVFPWLMALLLAGGAAGFAVWYLLRRASVPVLAAEPA